MSRTKIESEEMRAEQNLKGKRAESSDNFLNAISTEPKAREAAAGRRIPADAITTDRAEGEGGRRPQAAVYGRPWGRLGMLVYLIEFLFIF